MQFMSNVTSAYYFDVLPVHPPPERLESLTGYLTRIASANGIRRVRILSALFDVKIYKNLWDAPLGSFEEIALLTACTDSQILATTFFHLAKKFITSLHPRYIAGFLQNSLSSHLRYCPLCLAQAPYYRLTWRFLVLPGCNIHGCRFITQCELCKKPIPLFILPSEIGKCPLCRGDLLAYSVDMLSEYDMRKANYVTDIEYILSPSSLAEDKDFTRKVGYRFATLRRERQLSTQQIADCLSIPVLEVRNIEQGGVHQYTSLLGYLKYADYIGVSLQKICEYCKNATFDSIVYSQDICLLASLKQQYIVQPFESVIIEHIQEVVRAIESSEKLVTLSDIIKQMHTTSKKLRQYQMVNAFWEEMLSSARNEKAKQKRLTENELVEKVEPVMKVLLASGQLPTLENVGVIIGISGAKLGYYQRVKELFEQVPSQDYMRNKKQDKSLIEQLRVLEQKNLPSTNLIINQVNEAVRDLSISGKKVSPYSISKIVKIPIWQLKSIPQVKAILDRFVPKRKRKRKRKFGTA